MRELGTVILQNLAGRRLSALSRSVAPATILAPPQTVNTLQGLMKYGPQRRKVQGGKRKYPVFIHLILFPPPPTHLPTYPLLL